MKRICRTAPFSLVFLLLATVASASHGPLVQVRLMDLESPAKAGERLAATVVIHSRANLIVTDVRCGGDGWYDVQLDAPLALALGPEEEVRLQLHAIPSDPDRPLIISLEYDGRSYRRSFDLSAPTHDAAHHGRPIATIAASSPPPPEPSCLVAPAPPEPDFSKRSQEELVALDEVGSDPQRPERSGYEIRVTGRFVYYYPADQTHPVEENGAHGVTVRVYDQDSGPDDFLAATTASASGYFEVTFTWDPCALCDGTPDLYVEIEAANVAFDVEESDIWETNYKFVTETYHDYTGTELDFGVMSPADPGLYPALHILKTLTRGWLILYEEAGYEVPHIDAQWPDNSHHTSFYDGSEIHYTSDSQWSENTIFHEWGHHWVHSFAESPPPEYCNPGGHCDDPECGHCYWCPENETVAFTEGVPDWWAGYLIGRVEDLYDPDPRFRPNFELSFTCWENGEYGNPYTTEGWFCILLNDFEDATEEDHDTSVYGKDVVNLGFTTVLNFIDAYHPTTPRAFLDQMMAVSSPDFREAVWQTAANLGFTHLDTEPPPVPIDVVCLSHEIGVPSVDHTFHMAWTPPVDEASGVWGYDYSISEGGPEDPGQFPLIDDVDFFIVDYFPAGTYWFNLRTIDHAWHESTDYVSVGPLIIEDGGDCNLAYWSSFDWSRPLIPRAAPDVVWGGPYVDDPQTLDGNVATTYLNAYTGNFGGEPTWHAFWDYFWVDEELVWWNNWVEQPAWETMVALNLGPVVVPSGRHTLHAMLDHTEKVGELWETDNFEGHQWIWSPFVIVPGSPVLCNPPPWKNAGWTSVTDGQTLWSNCDGFRYTQTGWWQAAYLVQYEYESDYDLRLHTPSAGASDGFGAYLASSARTGGYLDAILVNGNQVAWQDWDVGVSNWNYHDALYSMVTTTSQGIALETPETIALGEFEMLALREFLGDPGLYTIAVEIDLPYRPVSVAWFDSEFTMGGLSSMGGLARTDSTGRAWLDVTLPQAGWHGIAVYRDQRDNVYPVQVTLEVYPMRPELYPVTPEGWYSPLVPRPAADALADDVSIPDSLTGETDQTWFNVAVTNESPVNAPSPIAHVYLDGDDITPVSIGYPEFTGDFPLINVLSAVTIPGGRHSLWMWIDDAEAIPERTELNNVYGEQWVWSPCQFVDEAPIVRSAPPWRMGGVDGMTVMEIYYYNCDGLRTPVLTPGVPGPDDGWWEAIAMQAGAGTSYDLRLYERAISAKEGFDSHLARSAWVGDATEFVLVNLTMTGERQFDVGVVNYGGEEDYLVHTDASGYHGAAMRGVFGPFTLDAWDIIDVHEFDLDASRLMFTVRDLSGEVDWGVSLYPHAQAYMGKSDAIDGAMSFLAGSGADESFVCEIPQAGRYALAVWRVGGGDLSVSGEYQLEIAVDPAGVPEEDPHSGYALAQNSPNPFGPGTTIRFDLLHDTAADLRIFDMSGRLVRVLLRKDDAPAGHHEVIWDGTDALGREVAAGVYFYRLEAGTFNTTKRMILLR
ncbi:MAG: T9SS type A sorting domain-containing protein [Candidatus Eisenbacteria sp.]|nr:T9SS type A sorting domain-containing protein [Candidatus Eisenbacteria bacterium]